MKKILSSLILVAALCVCTSGCKTPHAAPGGVYAPTNQVGAVIYDDTALALADASYKFTYESALTVFRFERDHRAEIAALSPSVGLDVKHGLDQARATTWEIDQRWAKARQAYKLSPTPAGLSTLQTILAEIQRLLPVVQTQLAPVTAVLTQPKTSTP